MKNFVGAVSVIFISACSPADSNLYSACDEAVKLRLKAPSSYERVGETKSETVIEETAFFLYRDVMDEKVRHAYRKGWADKPPTFKRYEVRLAYEAQNSFGARLRSAAKCEFYTDDGTTDDARAATVVIDGKTLQDWLLQAR